MEPGERGTKAEGVRAMGRGGVTESAAGGGTEGSTCLGEAGGSNAQSLSVLQSIRVEDKGLQETSEDGAEGLAGS